MIIQVLYILICASVNMQWSNYQSCLLENLTVIYLPITLSPPHGRNAANIIIIFFYRLTGALRLEYCPVY